MKAKVLCFTLLLVGVLVMTALGQSQTFTPQVIGDDLFFANPHYRYLSVKEKYFGREINGEGKVTQILRGPEDPELGERWIVRTKVVSHLPILEVVLFFDHRTMPTAASVSVGDWVKFSGQFWKVVAVPVANSRWGEIDVYISLIPAKINH